MSNIESVKKIYNSDLPPRAVAVWLYLNGRANNNTRNCFPSIGTISSEMKLSKSTVKRALTDLEKAGFIKKNKQI